MSKRKSSGARSRQKRKMNKTCIAEKSQPNSNFSGQINKEVCEGPMQTESSESVVATTNCDTSISPSSSAVRQETTPQRSGDNAGATLTSNVTTASDRSAFNEEAVNCRDIFREIKFRTQELVKTHKLCGCCSPCEYILILYRCLWTKSKFLIQVGRFPPEKCSQIQELLKAFPAPAVHRIFNQQVIPSQEKEVVVLCEEEALDPKSKQAKRHASTSTGNQNKRFKNDGNARNHLAKPNSVQNQVKTESLGRKTSSNLPGPSNSAQNQMKTVPLGRKTSSNLPGPSFTAAQVNSSPKLAHAKPNITQNQVKTASLGAKTSPSLPSSSSTVAAAQANSSPKLAHANKQTVSENQDTTKKQKCNKYFNMTYSEWKEKRKREKELLNSTSSREIPVMEDLPKAPSSNSNNGVPMSRGVSMAEVLPLAGDENSISTEDSEAFADSEGIQITREITSEQEVPSFHRYTQTAYYSRCPRQDYVTFELTQKILLNRGTNGKQERLKKGVYDPANIQVSSDTMVKSVPGQHYIPITTMSGDFSELLLRENKEMFDK